MAGAAEAPAGTTGEPKEPGPLRRAATGHVSNYDETKVGSYTLPPLLVDRSGRPVTAAAAWSQHRRAEVRAAYEQEIFGRVPERAPRARATVLSDNVPVENGAAVRKHVVLNFGPDETGPKADVVLYLPAAAKQPVPVLLHVVFFRGLPSEVPEPPLPPAFAKSGRAFSETGPVAEILARGYGYATFRYGEVQPDNKETHARGVQALAYAPGQTRPGPGEWGTITVWSWAASRVLDELSADARVDGSRVALIGHSRLGKTALWASALDPRFALTFASCSGEMGAALSRRDFGETVDDMAVSFPWWFAEGFQKYVGHWPDMPVDAHSLIALSAPRPVFLTGGTEDLWADPKGQFLAAVAAGPVYRLLGKRDLGTTELPPLDVALTDGSLGWRYHRGGHAILPGDWQAFLDFADRHLKR
ncbi:acetylxylan esterase [Opitutus sp. ER46]|nr:acetylxylan esterase [Opitutus sp. ER46]